MGHQFIGTLGRRVHADWMIDGVFDRKRHVGIGAVNRTGRRENKVFDVGRSASFKNVQKPDDVGVGISVRVFEAVAHASLSRQIDHPLRRMIGKQPGNGVPVFQVNAGFDEVGVALDAIQPGLLAVDLGERASGFVAHRQVPRRRRRDPLAQARAGEHVHLPHDRRSRPNATPRDNAATPAMGGEGVASVPPVR